MRLSRILLLALFVPLIAISAQAEESDLKVLYVGPSTDHSAAIPSYLTGKARDRFDELHKERPQAFQDLLSKHFKTVKVIEGQEYEVALSSQFDVTIFDTRPPTTDKIKQPGGWFKQIRLPDDFDQPALMIGEVAPMTIGRFGNDFLLDHL